MKSSQCRISVANCLLKRLSHLIRRQFRRLGGIEKDSNVEIERIVLITYCVAVDLPDPSPYASLEIGEDSILNHAGIGEILEHKFGKYILKRIGVTGRAARSIVNLAVEITNKSLQIIIHGNWPYSEVHSELFSQLA